MNDALDANDGSQPASTPVGDVDVDANAMSGDSIRQLAAEIFRDKVIRARSLSFAAKFRTGGDLFDSMSELSKAGIRHQFPDADEARVRAIFAERMRILRILNNGSIYRIVEAPE